MGIESPRPKGFWELPHGGLTWGAGQGQGGVVALQQDPNNEEKYFLPLTVGSGGIQGMMAGAFWGQLGVAPIHPNSLASQKGHGGAVAQQ